MLPLPIPTDEEAFLSSDGSSREREVLLRGSTDEAPPAAHGRRRRDRLCAVLCLSLSAAALVAAAAGGHLAAGSGNSIAQRGLALDEDSGRNSAKQVKEAMRAIESKDERREKSPTEHFDVFVEPFDWHKNDLQDDIIEDKLRSTAYKGQQGMWCVGINLLGFSLDAGAGRYGKYVGPSLDDIRYFHHMGANCFRLAVTWERLQSTLGSEELDLVPGIDEVVNLITDDLGDHVIMDPHNGEFGLQHNGVNVMRRDFAALWAAIARKWGSNDKVIFGLYNEPHGGYENGVERYFDRDASDESGDLVEFWRQWAQAGINAIRKTGASNLILVPGLHRSNAAEWAGALRWGEELAGGGSAGNTRLAALQDPAEHMAYDVHQHMDPSFTGTHPGCGGHEAGSSCRGAARCRGADWGLEQTVAWAQRYNKRLMLTEVSSVPGADADGGACDEKLHGYLQRLNDSGVFLGYQAWQNGCEFCLGDISPGQPRKLDRYRLHDFGRPCSEDLEDCRSTRCCKAPGSRCYQKDDGWAACKATCRPGIDRSEERKFRTNWTCLEVKYSAPVCSDDTEDCSGTGCCNDPSKKCYQKEKGWAVCRTECAPGELWEKDDPAHRVPWNCTLLTAVTRIQLK
mmetsp:Transcript_38265/g.110518  ORF Transcript_38265/g.110518 Transcript_38265/m.110518 type:complete len:626 (+) Transcript_38265:79-1956(+)